MGREWQRLEWCIHEPRNPKDCHIAIRIGERGTNIFSLSASRRNQHYKHLDFRLRCSGLWKIKYLLLALRFQVICYGCPRKLMHLLGHQNCLRFVLIIWAWPCFASWLHPNFTPFCTGTNICHSLNSSLTTAWPLLSPAQSGFWSWHSPACLDWGLVLLQVADKAFQFCLSAHVSDLCFQTWIWYSIWSQSHCPPEPQPVCGAGCKSPRAPYLLVISPPLRTRWPDCINKVLEVP